jgi:hypothetical protein
MHGAAVRDPLMVLVSLRVLFAHMCYSSGLSVRGSAEQHTRPSAQRCDEWLFGLFWRRACVGERPPCRGVASTPRWWYFDRVDECGLCLRARNRVLCVRGKAQGLTKHSVKKGGAGGKFAWGVPGDELRDEGRAAGASQWLPAAATRPPLSRRRRRCECAQSPTTTRWTRTQKMWQLRREVRTLRYGATLPLLPFAANLCADVRARVAVPGAGRCGSRVCGVQAQGGAHRRGVPGERRPQRAERVRACVRCV